MTTAIVVGVVIGTLYTLSPLTVLCVSALAALAWWVGRDLTSRERGWFFGALTLAMALRLAAIAALFLLADPATPYASFLGDEELFKSRTLWLRNAGLGVPISPADIIYVFDDVGQTSHLYVLAYLQALVGDAYYGNNVFNAFLYVAGIVVMYRFIRPAYGSLAAMGGFIGLLFLPSLFLWSISVLKEPLYILVAALEVVCAAQIIRAPRVWMRIAAAAGVIAAALALESLRTGGVILAVGGTVTGLMAGVVVTRPRVTLASLVVVPVVGALLWTQPAVQERVMKALEDAAFQHWGHIATPGYTYETLDPRFYLDAERMTVYTMTPSETGRFIVRAVASYIAVPLPWQIESRSALAYLPEQVLWYLMVAMIPLGVLAGLRRDAVMTCLLLSHAFAAVMIVALSGGNIGTLIRHRAIALPYLAYIAALGACDLVRRVTARAPAPLASTVPHGEPAWR